MSIAKGNVSLFVFGAPHAIGAEPLELDDPPELEDPPELDDPLELEDPPELEELCEASSVDPELLDPDELLLPELEDPEPLELPPGDAPVPVVGVVELQAHGRQSSATTVALRIAVTCRAAPTLVASPNLTNG